MWKIHNALFDMTIVLLNPSTITSTQNNKRCTEFFSNRPSQQRKANCTIRTHGYLSNEATLFFSFVCVLFRWSWPGHTRGCGSRRRIWCSKRTAWRGLDRWPGPFSSLLYLSHTPPAYPQGSLSPLRVYGLQAADVYSLWKQRNDFTLKI